MLYPLVTDEISDRMTVRTFPRVRTSDDGDVHRPSIELEEGEEKRITLENDDKNNDKKSTSNEKENTPPPTVTTPPPPERGFSQSIQSSVKGALAGSFDDRRKIALSFVTDVVDQVGPSVVRVDTETHLQDNLRDAPQPPGSYIQQGQGSGLIFSSEGLILTNAHVVEDATIVKGTFDYYFFFFVV